LRTISWLAVFFFLATGVGAQANTDPADLLKTGRADQALHALNLTVAQNPNDAKAYNLLSRVYFQLELWDNAVRMAEKALALDPQNSAYHLWLGRAMGRKAEDSNPFTAFGLARKVKAEFERAVALDADNLPARSDLCEFYLEAPSMLGGDKVKAKQLADYVAKRDPAMGSYMYARVAEKRGDTGAETEYKKAVAASSAPGHYWIELAHFYRRAGRLGDMETALNQAVAAAKAGDFTEYDAAALLLHTGRNYAGAAQMLRHYVAQEDPAEDGPAFRAHYLLGIVLEKQGKKSEASAEFQTSLKMASQYRPAQDALARVSR
jgi:cytochrome c-type biogenesis protein CcmH/NrfG